MYDHLGTINESDTLHSRGLTRYTAHAMTTVRISQIPLLCIRMLCILMTRENTLIYLHYLSDNIGERSVFATENFRTQN